MIVMLAGLPGTGKSALAESLARRNQAVRAVNKDALRAALFNPRRDPYSPQQNDFVMELMLATAAHWLGQGVAAVLLDGRTFSRASQRGRVIDFALQLGVPWRLVECTCPDEMALGRLSEDHGHPARDRDAALFRKVKAEFEPIPPPKLVVDTSRPVAQCVSELEAYLRPKPTS